MDNEKDKAVKEHFKEIADVIYNADDQSSFIDMCYKISISDDFKKVINSGAYNLKLYEVSDASFDIAANLAMIYWYWTLPLDEDSKKAKWDDREYITKIKTKVTRQCRKRLNLTICSLTNYYSHVPILYSMHVLTNRCRSELDDYLNKVERISLDDKITHYDYVSFKRMFSLCDSILSLIESFDFSSAYSLLRSLIELFFTYLAINGKESAIDEYYKFSRYSSYKDVYGEPPEEMKKHYPKKYHKDQSFLNYGWLLSLAKEREDSLKDLKFKFATVVDYCQNEGAKKEGERWTEMYKKCCRYVHASPFERMDRNADFLELSCYLSTLLTNIGYQFASVYKNEIDSKSISDLTDDLEKERKTYDIIARGYNKKINKEYVDMVNSNEKDG